MRYLSLLKYFNLLEKNVGLCISYLENSDDPKVSYSILRKMTAEQKLERLKELFDIDAVIIDKKGVREFEEWFAFATRARSIRNRYVHGQWEYLPLRSDKPVGFEPPVWMQEKLGYKLETMSVSELEAVVEEI